MSDTTNPTPEEPQESEVQTVEALLDRLDAVHADFKKRTWWAKFGNITTVVIGFLLVAVLVGYFTFGYVQIKDLTESRMLYALLEQNLRNTKMPGTNRGVPTTLSQARRYLENEIEKTSVRLAGQLSQQLLDNGPRAREEMERFALMQAEQVLDQGTQLTSQKFRVIINNNRSLIESCISDLSENDELAEERLEELVSAMEDEMQADLKKQADEILRAARFANDKLRGLSKGEGLNHEQKLERQFVMILRRMQMENGDPKIGKELIESEILGAEIIE